LKIGKAALRKFLVSGFERTLDLLASPLDNGVIYQRLFGAIEAMTNTTHSLLTHQHWFVCGFHSANQYRVTTMGYKFYFCTFWSKA